MKPLLRGFFALGLLLVVSCSKREPVAAEAAPNDVTIPISFDGQADRLTNTEVVATLDAPISQGRSAIWCASFQSAWKALQQDILRGPILLAEATPVAAALNAAADPRTEVPADSQCVAAGWVREGIVAKLQADFQRKFPGRALPVFLETNQNTVIAYAYLETDLKFTLPYRQNVKPLVFTNSLGEKTEIMSFGVLSEDRHVQKKLRAQTRVLFRKRDEDFNFEFAIDLCADSSPSQVVVAKIKREPSLAAALVRVEQEAAAWENGLRRSSARTAEHLKSIGSNDILLVPDIYWAIFSHFRELEGKAINNAGIQNGELTVAQQDLRFRLSRSGATLKAEARSRAVERSTTQPFILDGPFLVYLKQRGAKNPYFAMWVDNAELLQKWIEHK